MYRSSPQMLRALRAVAEPTRLRILAVLAQGEHSVTDLTLVLGQSQPRMSRHLKLLGEAGLLERFREQHFIFYRLPTGGPGGELVRQLLALVDPQDPTFRRDRERSRASLAERAGGLPDPAPGATVPAETERAERELVALVAAELGAHAHDSLLYVGHAPVAALEAIGPRARRAVGVCPSRAEVQRARALLHGRGLAHCALQQGGPASLADRDDCFDAVVLDRSLRGELRPAALLREAAGRLEPGGQLLLVEDYDSLADAALPGNPLMAVRRWLAEAGLACLRLRPVDLDGGHVLLAVASAGAAARQAA